MDINKFDDKGNLEQEFDLEMNLDDIEDLPGFAVFPSGAYTILVPEMPERKQIDVADGKKQTVVECKMQLLEVMEMTEKVEEEEMPKINDITTVTWNQQNRFGVDAMVKFLRPIAKHFGTSKPSETFGKMKGTKLLIVVKRTYNKDKDRHYQKIKKVAVL
jgi:hypothetical protein